MKFKDLRNLEFSAFYVCQEYNCKLEATKIWASSESIILDLCDLHYEKASKQ